MEERVGLTTTHRAKPVIPNCAAPAHAQNTELCTATSGFYLRDAAGRLVGLVLVSFFAKWQGSRRGRRSQIWGSFSHKWVQCHFPARGRNPLVRALLNCVICI